MSEKKRVDYFINHSSSNLNSIKPYKIWFYHLVLVLEGSCTYIADGETIVLKKNDVLLLTPETFRERFANHSYIHIVIFNFFGKNEYMPTENHVYRNAINQIIRNLLDVYPYKTYIALQKKNEISSSDFKSLKQTEVLNHIFECIMLELFETSQNQSNNPHVTNILKYINENINAPLTLTDVCRHAHLSKEYTARLFKQETGMTISEYINKEKLYLAKNMLETPNMSLKKISSNLGYENYSYFTKLFKDMFNISPQKMRNEAKKHNE